MFERFTGDARATVVTAQAEARALGHNYVGTEHLLLALLREGSHPAGAALARLGLDHDGVRSDVVRIIGHGGRLDGEALAAIGIDLDAVRRRVEAAFGPGALDAARPGCRDPSLAFTPRSKKVLELAVREAAAARVRAIGAEHILLGLARVGGGVAAEVMAARGVTAAAIQAQVRRAA